MPWALGTFEVAVPGVTCFTLYYYNKLYYILQILLFLL